MKFISVLLFTLVFAGIGGEARAQEPQFLDGGLRTVEKKQLAQFVRTLEKVSENDYTGTIHDLNGNVKIIGTYFMTTASVLEHGVFTFYYPDGRIESRGSYAKGVKVGSWERYASDGTRKPDRFYNPESAEMIRAVMQNK